MNSKHIPRLTLAQRILFRKQPLGNHDLKRPETCFCLQCKCNLLIKWFDAQPLEGAKDSEHAWTTTTRNLYILSPKRADGERIALAMI